MVSPEHKRRAVRQVVEAGLCSLRRACRYLRLGRSSLCYRPKRQSDYEASLVERLRALSKAHPTYGYRFITALLKREGWRVNRKKVQRLRRAECLAAHQAKKKRKRSGESTAQACPKAMKKNDIWSWDFIFDTTENGRTIKILSIVDEASRFCIDLHVREKLDGEAVLKALDQACRKYGAPRHIRSDNGPEFIAKEVQRWVESRSIETAYIEPGSPWQNGYVESFHSRFRNDCLNRELFLNLLDAQVAIADWREDYNERRPHSGLDYQSPSEIYFVEDPGCVRATPSLHRGPPQNPTHNEDPQTTEIPAKLTL